MKLRIVGDGTLHGTRVETEDGYLIEGVQAVTWELAAKQVGGHSRAVIQVDRVAIDVFGEAPDE